MQTLLKKLITKETILYIIFGILTTLTDWLTYACLRHIDITYQLATVLSWAAAVAFAFITNKLFVFESKDLSPQTLWKEAISFTVCRAATGLFTLIAMIALVDGLGIRQDMICKIFISAVSLILNYILSKLFIFKKAGQNSESKAGSYNSINSQESK